MGRKAKTTKKNVAQEEVESFAMDRTNEEKLQTLKQQKTKDKSKFTKEKNRLLTLLEDDLPSRTQVRKLIDELCSIQENIFETLIEISDIYKANRDMGNVTKITDEMDTVQAEFYKIEGLANDYLESRKYEESSIASNTSSRVNRLQSKQYEIRKEVNTLEKEVKEEEDKYQLMKEKMEQEIERKKLQLQGRQKEADRMFKEIETAVEEELGLVDEGKNTLNPLAEEYRHPAPSVSKELGHDLWKQLKRVSIPVFHGDKKSYEGWKAAFFACVDKAPATSEYKLLQLRQYLSGEALKTIEGLGHSAAAYEAAKRRLDRKFGGKRRQVALCFEEIENLAPVQQGNAKDIERFADLLDVAILNLQEVGRNEELGNGTFYTKLLKKLPETMITQYQRWIFDKEREESVDVLREWIIQEADFQTIATETIHGLTGKIVKPQRKPAKVYFTRDSNMESKALNTKSCTVCGKQHPVWRCEVFRRMNVKDRWEKAKAADLCYRCLGNGHLGQACSRSRICGIDGCKQSHNRLLHREKDSAPNGKEDQRRTTIAEPVTIAATTSQGDPVTEGERKQERAHTVRNQKDAEEDEYVALRTVPVRVKKNGKELVINALLDDASTKTYINSDVAAELGAEGTTQVVRVNVLNDRVETLETMPVELQLQSLDGNVEVAIEAFTADKVTGDMKAIDWKRFSKQWTHLKDIKFPSLGKKSTVDMLIGMDHADMHFSLQDIKGNPGEPIARLTPLGWTCIGEPFADKAPTQMTRFVRSYVSRFQDQTNKLLQRFWTIEEGQRDTVLTSHDDRVAMKTVQQSLKWDGNMYQVGIPWRPDVKDLPENYFVAQDRLRCTEKKLIKNPGIAQVYRETLQQYLAKGYMRKVMPNEVKKKSWYLPHFPVVREDKATSKVRIVFDAAAKCSGMALNDVIYQGPKLQRDLCAVLLRFRRFPIALVCDIAEMYLRIGMAPQDRPYHRLLWRDLDQTKTPDVYEMNSLVFGNNASPFLAQYVSQEHARRYLSEVPAAAETILESTYMDDSMDSVANTTDGVKLFKELSWLWKKANMHPRKWLSNSEEILEQIPVADRANTVNLQDETLPSVKTLGILWKAKEDIFTFSVTAPPENFVYSKRNFLRKIATLFDPLGFLAPYLIQAKMLLQDMWLSGIDWDDAMTKEQENRARRWFDDLNYLHELQVPRALQIAPEISSFTIHTFVDASEKAYGSVVYARCKYNTGQISTNIVSAKSRVSPLSSTSIPRLEMCGAVLGLRLSQNVTKALKTDVKDVTFWTDSMNVIYWIRNQSRKFKPFIANRVGEIHAATEPHQWRYVPTKVNPADDISRGLTVKEMIDRTTWWKGPSFLSDDESKWPKNQVTDIAVDNTEERQKYKVTFAVLGIATENLDESRLAPTRYSNWKRLTRIVAWVHRFINNCRVAINERNHQQLQAEEILEAENLLIRNAQRTAYPNEYKCLAAGKAISVKSQIISLNPTIDEDGLLRADGRIKDADYLPFNTRYPIILPRKSWTTKLIVKDCHEEGNHILGTNHALTKLSTKFWIPQAREEIREWERECYTCKRQKAKAATQIMAPLPSIRTKLPLRAFSRSSVDFGGPFITIQGRGKQRIKRYLCLFTCLASRAVHLEMAYSLETDSFLNAFYRMVNRRGPVIEIISDNGTNFVGANREIQELVAKLDKDKIQESTANKGVKWHFNPPLAPHFGGAHETMIKAAKKAINAILGNAEISDEELTTALTGAEALINSRPLTYQSANPKDDVPLTPNHFLFGQAGGEFAPDSVDSTNFSLKKRWRRVQELVRHFWRRWMREWLPGLNARRKWVKENRDIRIDDIVLVVDPQNERGKWPIARVTEVFPGKDGKVRVVNLKVGNKEFRRPITKVCPLDCDISIDTTKIAN